MRAIVATSEHTSDAERRQGGAGALAKFLGLAVVALVAASGCAPTFVYRPAGPEFGGAAAAHYPIPPQRPAGEAYLTSFGFSDIDVGGGQDLPFMHARIALANASNQPWTLDGREQQLVAAAGQPPASPAFLNTDAGEFGGGGLGNLGRVTAGSEAYGRFPCTLRVTLPPLSAVWFRPVSG